MISTVVQRNRELRHLGAFVATADVSTPRDRSFFWSGDARSPTGEVTASAMETAQHVAGLAGGRTVEMTPGGGRWIGMRGPTVSRICANASGILSPGGAPA